MLIKERKSQRLKNYDYASNNNYFVTICTAQMKPFFGEIADGRIIFNELGKIVEKQWLWLQDQYNYVYLDEFVIMPNHFHGILIINSNNIGNTRECSLLNSEKIKPLSELIGAFKTTSSKLIHKIDENIHFSREHSRVFPTTEITPQQFKWQKSFHDRIIRNEIELNNIRNYIKNNPQNWKIDEKI